MTEVGDGSDARVGGPATVRLVLVRLRRPSLDQRVPPDLVSALGLTAAEVLRPGTVGFTARLSPTQRAVAANHPLVSRLEENPDCLAPIRQADQPPDVPGRYVVCVLREVGPDAVIAAAGLPRTDIDITGMWFTATLNAARLATVRRTPGVDFVAPAVMEAPD